MRTYLVVAAFAAIALAGCTQNPADKVAQQDTVRPIALHYVFETPSPGDTFTEPASLKANPYVKAGQVFDDFYSEYPIPQALSVPLITRGYARLVYHRLFDGQFQRRLQLTSKGLSEHWACDDDKGCAVPIGTMKAGKAEIADLFGRKFVRYDCTPEPSEIGVAAFPNTSYGATFATDNFHREGNDAFAWGKTSVCTAWIGPAGNIESP